DQIYATIKKSRPQSPASGSQPEGELAIILDDQVWLKRGNIPPSVVRYIREELNFINSDYLIKKKLGRSTWQTEKYFKLIAEQEDLITLPRGFLPELITFCREQAISCHIEDCRQEKSPVTYRSSIELYPHQK